MPRKTETRRVYSTDGGRCCPGCGEPVSNCRCKALRADTVRSGDGIVRLRRERKGRGGKAVTVIDGLSLAPDALKTLAADLKRRCGVGGAVRDGCIELQGDQRNTLKPILEADGHKVKLAGG